MTYTLRINLSTMNSMLVSASIKQIIDAGKQDVADYHQEIINRSWFEIEFESPVIPRIGEVIKFGDIKSLKKNIVLRNIPKMINDETAGFEEKEIYFVNDYDIKFPIEIVVNSDYYREFNSVNDNNVEKIIFDCSFDQHFTIMINFARTWNHSPQGICLKYIK